MFLEWSSRPQKPHASLPSRPTSLSVPTSPFCPCRVFSTLLLSPGAWLQESSSMLLCLLSCSWISGWQVRCGVGSWELTEAGACSPLLSSLLSLLVAQDVLIYQGPHLPPAAPDPSASSPPASLTLLSAGPCWLKPAQDS